MDEPRDTTPLPIPYETPAPARSPEYLQPRLIFIDVLIVFGLTFVGGFFVAITAPMLSISIDVFNLLVMVSSFILASLGFLFSGLRAPHGNRWPHLLWVALGVWLTSLINLAFGTPLLIWLLSSIFVLLTMSIGGLASMALRR